MSHIKNNEIKISEEEIVEAIININKIARTHKNRMKFTQRLPISKGKEILILITKISGKNRFPI